MNTRNRSAVSLVVAAVAISLLASCATQHPRLNETAALRDRLTRLQSDPQLASRAPVAMKDAEVALQAAEKPERDSQQAAFRLFIADRKIDTADALAHERLLVDQRTQLAEARDAMRLRARTQEADIANARTRIAQADAQAQRQQTAAANDRSAMATADALELQHQVDLLNAKVTERGLVITLGDVLFATGSATLRPAGDNHLEQLAGFLRKYPERTLRIEGHTDNVGKADSNLALSRHRADAVKTYLVDRGVDSMRITAAGLGEGSPVSNNESSTGRQQNRRVEVIMADAAPALR